MIRVSFLWWWKNSKAKPEKATAIEFDTKRANITYTLIYKLVSKKQVAEIFKQLIILINSPAQVSAEPAIAPSPCYVGYIGKDKNNLAPDIKGDNNNVSHQYWSRCLGNDPKTSVLNINCRTDDSDDLYLVALIYYPTKGSMTKISIGQL